MNKNKQKIPVRWIKACVNFRDSTRMTSCGAKGSLEMLSTLENGIAERDLMWKVERVHCMGKCHLGPTMRIMPTGRFIVGVKKNDVPLILDMLEHNQLDDLTAAFQIPVPGNDA